MKSRFLSWYSFLLCLAVSGLSCDGGQAGLFCGKQLECTQPGKPICSLAICTGCSQDADCKTNWMQRKQESEAAMMSLAGPMTVACEASTGTCSECLNDAHCAESRAGEPLLRVCDPNFKKCVGCLQNSDCAANAAAAADGLLTCDTSQKECIDCMTPSDCNARPGMPYCVANRCSACEKDSNCTGVAGKPYCATTSTSARSQCVSCTGQAVDFCSKRNAATPFCDGTGTCAPCTKHEDCGNGPGTSTGSGVCYRPGDYAPPAAVGTLTPGQCVPESFVKDVTPSTIAAEISGNGTYLRLADGNYGDLSIGREVVLVGRRNLDQANPSAAKAIVGSVTVTAGRVTVYDVRIERVSGMAAKPTVKCSGGQVQLRLTRLSNRSAESAVDASSGCQEFRLTQSFVESEWQALLLTATSLNYSVTNTMVLRSGSPGGPPFHANAVELGLSATGTFAYNTLYYNQSGIVCVNNQPIANTVITGVTGSAVLGCIEQSVYKNIAAGAPADYVETASGSGVFHPSTAMQANLKAKAMQATNPAITTDLFGGARPRPAATTPDIGCEELP
jgi:hypothetical protein